jgi:hypothetical protein
MQCVTLFLPINVTGVSNLLALANVLSFQLHNMGCVASLAALFLRAK